MLAPNSKDKLVSGKDELLKAGIYAPTTGGKFSATFYEGNSGTLMTLYSQYSTVPEVFVDPTKSVDKSKAKVGDKITYTVKHTMGTFYKTTMTVYGKFVIEDVLPKEVTYKSAKLTNGKGTDITSSGTLSYDSSTRTVKFVMGDPWRKNTANYNGQVLKFTIQTEANDFNGTLVTAKNTADLSYENNLTVTTNRVTTDIEKDAPVNPPVTPDPPVKPDPPVNPPVTPDPPVNPPVDPPVRPDPPVEPPKPTTLKLQLVKRIPNEANQLGDGHGNPTFIFKITGRNSGKVWYRSVTYGASSVSNGWSFVNENGYKVAYGPVETFPVDTYSVSEINVSRFTQKQSNKSESGDKTTFSFTNEKDNWQYFSHKSVVINTERGGAADVWN